MRDTTVHPITILRNLPGTSKKFMRLAGYGKTSLWSIFKTNMLIYYPKANLDEECFLGKSKIFKTRNLENVCKGFVRNRESHAPFRSMIYVPLKFTLDAIVCFKNRNLTSIVRKS